MLWMEASISSSTPALAIIVVGTGSTASEITVTFVNDDGVPLVDAPFSGDEHGDAPSHATDGVPLGAAPGAAGYLPDFTRAGEAVGFSAAGAARVPLTISSCDRRGGGAGLRGQRHACTHERRRSRAARAHLDDLIGRADEVQPKDDE